MTKCPHCQGNTVKIMGKVYCPACYNKGSKAHKKTKLSFKKSLLALGFSLFSLSISGSLFLLIYNASSNSLSQPTKYVLTLLFLLVTFFVGGAILYWLDRDNLILNALIISVLLSALGISLGAFQGFDNQSSLGKNLFDIYLFLLMFLTGAFIVDHYKNRR